MPPSNEMPRLPTPLAQEASLLDLLVVLRDGAKWLIGLPLGAGVLAVALSFLIRPTFTSTITIMTPQQQQSSALSLLGSLSGMGGGGGGGLSALAGLKNPADQWVGLLKSRTIADALVDRFKLKDRYGADYYFEAREKLAKFSDIQAGKDSLIDISVDDRDPKTAAALATAYVQELQKLSKTLAVTEAAQRRLFFEHQLSDAKINLTKAQEALAESGISANVLKTSPEAAVEGIAALKARVTELELRIAVMRNTLTDGSAEMQQAQAALASLRSQLARAALTDPPAARGDKTKPSYIERYRDFKYYETLFELLARQYELARSDEAKDGAVIQVVDTAQVPEWKSAPKRGKIGVLAFLVTIIFAALWLFARQACRNAAADPVAAQKLQALRWRRGKTRAAT